MQRKTAATCRCDKQRWHGLHFDAKRAISCSTAATTQAHAPDDRGETGQLDSKGSQVTLQVNSYISSASRGHEIIVVPWASLCIHPEAVDQRETNCQPSSQMPDRV